MMQPLTSQLAQSTEEQENGHLDVGEKAPERPPSTQEVEARNQERVSANVELVNKMLLLATGKGLVTESEIDAFTLPNRSTSVRGLRRGIEEVTDKLNATGLDESEQEEAKLQEDRARLVTELLYSVTALVKNELPKKIVSLVREVKEQVGEATSGNPAPTAAIEKLQSLQQLTPQWEALTKNSDDVMKHFRNDHSAVITDELLGTLNNSLYLSVNKETSNLAITEKLSGGGTLLDEMHEIQKNLSRLLSIDLTRIRVDGTTAEEEAKPDLAPEKAEADVPEAPDSSPVITDVGEVTQAASKEDPVVEKV